MVVRMRKMMVKPGAEEKLLYFDIAEVREVELNADDNLGDLQVNLQFVTSMY